MRKSFFIIILLSFILSTNSIFAESWDDFANLDRAWDAQRTIDNKDYEDVVNALEEKKEKVEQKKKKKKFKSLFGRGGTTLHKELNPDKEVKDIPDLKPNKNGILINIPVDLYLDNHILERGYYNVIAKRNDDKKIYWTNG